MHAYGIIDSSSAMTVKELTPGYPRQKGKVIEQMQRNLRHPLATPALVQNIFPNSCVVSRRHPPNQFPRDPQLPQANALQVSRVDSAGSLSCHRTLLAAQYVHFQI